MRSGSIYLALHLFCILHHSLNKKFFFACYEKSKSTTRTLTVPVSMALALMIVVPALTGAFSQQNPTPSLQEVCASSSGPIQNCCKYDAYYGGPSGPKGYELYPGACSKRDKGLEVDQDILYS